MLENPSLRAAWLTARIFLPSRLSLALCALVGVLAMVVHVLIIGVNQGAILPDFLGGQWAAAYNTVFREPMDAFLSKTSLNSALEVVIWGVIGLTVYSLAEKFLNNYSEWRDAERSVQIIGPGKVVRHPLERSFYSILAWRLTNAILIVIWASVALVFLRQLLQTNGIAIIGSDSHHFNAYLVSLAVQWFLISHGLVVLLRLASRKARLFGNNHHYDQQDEFFRD